VYAYSLADHYKQPRSIYHDVVDLAKELRAQLGASVWTMTAEEMNEKVKEIRGAMTLDVENVSKSRRQQRRDLLRRGKREMAEFRHHYDNVPRSDRYGSLPDAWQRELKAREATLQPRETSNRIPGLFGRLAGYGYRPSRQVRDEDDEGHILQDVDTYRHLM